MDIDTWKINYELHRDPHDLAEFWKDGAPPACALALKAAVSEIEQLREALKEAAYLLGITDLDGNWLGDPFDTEQYTPGERRIVQAMLDRALKVQSGGYMTCTVCRINKKVLVDSHDVEALNQRVHHLNECLREVTSLVLYAHCGEERYPLAYAECKALRAGKGVGK